MKTPEELVRDLRTTARYLKCSQCFVECLPSEECVFITAAKMIEELEQGLGRVKRERDALLADVKSAAEPDDICVICVHYSETSNCDFECDDCAHGCMCNKCAKNDRWEWRGVREVAEDA
ncbi:MAG: hypothetical protein IIY16_05135 [Oscillospiraceae bacterium]|nr:hypothetical protein [Oscillospiraceae bacterium]